MSRRLRQALTEFRDSDAADDVEPDVVSDDAEAMDDESLERRVAALEAENRQLRELVESQGNQLEELERRVAALEGREQQPSGTEAVDPGDGQEREWRPPRRRPGMPNVGVVTLEEQPGEERAFGPAAPLVAEWRELRTMRQTAGSRVDRAKAAVRRWELEAEMLGEFHLILPPETHPLDHSRRADHLRRRQDALEIWPESHWPRFLLIKGDGLQSYAAWWHMINVSENQQNIDNDVKKMAAWGESGFPAKLLAEARRELGRAKRIRLMRRVMTLGLWQE